MIPLAFSIDDDRTSQILMAAHLKDVEFCESFISKGNGQEALDYFHSALETEVAIPSVIFLDIKMPILDGWGFLEGFNALVDKLESLPLIVMVSATKTPADCIRAEAHPLVADLIQKPISSDALVKLKNTPKLAKHFVTLPDELVS